MYQCDQMARLFFNFYPFTYNFVYSIQKVAKVDSNFYQKLKSENLPKWQI